MERTSGQLKKPQSRHVKSQITSGAVIAAGVRCQDGVYPSRTSGSPSQIVRLALLSLFLDGCEYKV